METNESKKVGRNTPCPCGSGKKYKKCCLNKPKEQPSSTNNLKSEKISDIGTSNPAVARLGLGMFELIDFVDISQDDGNFIKEHCLELMSLVAKAEQVAIPIIEEIKSILDVLNKNGVPQDKNGRPYIPGTCKRLAESEQFLYLAKKIMELFFANFNRLWKTNFSIEQISALKEFLGKKLGAEHILFKLINDDASWLNDLNSLINLTGKDFPSKVFDFKVSEQDIDGKFTVTLPSFSNGLQIASYLEVLSYNLLTFVEEFLTFSLAENLDNRLTVYDIPEQLRNKSAAVRFKVGVKEGIDISQFKNDAKFSKIYRSGQQQYQLRDKFRESRFGKVKPIIHSEYNGKKAIVVGNTVHFGDWKTFIDFLYDYLKIKFGKDWWRNEATKPEDSCSPVMNWARQYFIHQRQHSTKEDGLFCIDPNGPMHAYLSLAYDLFILEDNQKLQETLIARMRQPNKSNFMGARYEATVASIFIKAGFDIEYEDESDSSEKHPEFIAIHKNTGERIAVEAKKRNRGAITESDNEAQRGITGLLKDAISKFKGIPYIIFMELGLPPIDGNPMEKPWIKKLLDTQNLSGMRDAEGKDCCNMVVFTNYPTEHPEEISKFPKHSYIVSQSLVPKVEIKNRFHLQEIVAVLDKQSQIPSWFDE